MSCLHPPILSLTAAFNRWKSSGTGALELAGRWFQPRTIFLSAQCFPTHLANTPTSDPQLESSGYKILAPSSLTHSGACRLQVLIFFLFLNKQVLCGLQIALWGSPQSREPRNWGSNSCPLNLPYLWTAKEHSPEVLIFLASRCGPSCLWASWGVGDGGAPEPFYSEKLPSAP